MIHLIIFLIGLPQNLLVNQVNYMFHQRLPFHLGPGRQPVFLKNAPEFDGRKTTDFCIPWLLKSPHHACCFKNRVSHVLSPEVWRDLSTELVDVSNFRILFSFCQKTNPKVWHIYQFCVLDPSLNPPLWSHCWWISPFLVWKRQFILFPLFEAIYSPYRFCGWNSMKLSPMGSKFQSCWIAIFPVGFGPGWTRWKYLRFLNGWTTNEMTPYHSTICCNINPSSPTIANICNLKMVSRNLRNTSLRLHSHQWALQEGSLGRRRTPAKTRWGFVVKTTNLGKPSEIMKVGSMEFIGAIFFGYLWFFSSQFERHLVWIHRNVGLKSEDVYSTLVLLFCTQVVVAGF